MQQSTKLLVGRERQDETCQTRPGHNSKQASQKLPVISQHSAHWEGKSRFTFNKRFLKQFSFQTKLKAA